MLALAALTINYPAPRVRWSLSTPRQDVATQIARLAIGSLHTELMLHPKPGLVTPFCNGSHSDMHAGTFMHSLFTLRHYFKKISRAGIEGADFSELRRLGIAAERTMLRATAGVNTHRGAIFGLGLLSAAIGAVVAGGEPHDPAAIRQILQVRWGAALQQHAAVATATSHGQQVALRHLLSGAREEAANGFPSVFEIGLPRLQKTLAAGRDWECACIDTLFALMAYVSDTNVAHRGGTAGATVVRKMAHEFLARGATALPDWRQRALACSHRFVALNLSPGGAADLLAATCLVYRASERGAFSR